MLRQAPREIEMKILRGVFLVLAGFVAGVLYVGLNVGQNLQKGSEVSLGDRHFLPVEFEKADNGLCDLFLKKSDGAKDYLRRIECPKE